jgi:Holliday junction resolvasome RuvABC endonuclease subunit
MLLSLDIAGANMGYSIWNTGSVLSCGVIKTEKSKGKRILVSDDYFRRSTELYAGLYAVMHTWKPSGVIGELPSGSQNAVAAKLLGIATCAVACACHVASLPFEGCTQQAVKKAACGRNDASKDDIMDAVAEKLNIRVDRKQIDIKRGKRAGKVSEQKTFYFCGGSFPAKEFEHIADSIVVYWALQNNNLVRLFG